MEPTILALLLASGDAKRSVSNMKNKNIMSKRNWTIRKAVVSDAEALAECMHASYLVYTPRLGDKTLPPMRVDYKEEIRTYPVWMAEFDGKLVGGLILMPEEDYMTIANVAVHPQFQGNGLGRGLMEFGETEAKKRGYSELCLTTHILLTENISLYLHLGWSETDRDEYRVYMRKIIK
jgi:N-acetylglutamate synthase-like GNAT family acetyltransferase